MTRRFTSDSPGTAHALTRRVLGRVGGAVLAASVGALAAAWVRRLPHRTARAGGTARLEVRLRHEARRAARPALGAARRRRRPALRRLLDAEPSAARVREDVALVQLRNQVALVRVTAPATDRVTSRMTVTAAVRDASELLH